jgi:L-2-hydroxyglutarate oxidase LhgO
VVRRLLEACPQEFPRGNEGDVPILGKGRLCSQLAATHPRNQIRRSRTKAGVRAQALLNDGNLVDDFLMIRGHNALHVCNAPSPGATAFLEIAKAIVAQIPEQSEYRAFTRLKRLQYLIRTGRIDLGFFWKTTF